MNEPLIHYIKDQIHRNRCVVILCVGRVGTGKSWSCLKLASVLDPSFDVNRVVFNLKDLLNLVHNGEVGKGEVIVFDEAGISVSNRNSYMNMFNKAMSHLLQTWRHRNHILFITVPSISFIDKGIRSMFDMMIETTQVIKSRNVVQCDLKMIQHNYQIGKTYYYNARMDDGTQMLLEVGKPNIKLINRYEKKKTEFTTGLYEELMTELTPQQVDSKEVDKIGTCAKCGTKGDFSRIKKKWACRRCPYRWENEDT